MAAWRHKKGAQRRRRHKKHEKHDQNDLKNANLACYAPSGSQESRFLTKAYSKHTENWVTEKYDILLTGERPGGNYFRVAEKRGVAGVARLWNVRSTGSCGKNRANPKTGEKLEIGHRGLQHSNQVRRSRRQPMGRGSKDRAKHHRFQALSLTQYMRLPQPAPALALVVLHLAPGHSSTRRNPW